MFFAELVDDRVVLVGIQVLGRDIEAAVASRDCMLIPNCWSGDSEAEQQDNAHQLLDRMQQRQRA